MNVRKILRFGLLAAAFVFAARPALAGFEISYFNDFQKSLDKLVPGAALDKCITKDTLKLGFERETSFTERMAPGKLNGYAALTNTCGSSIWMLANLTGDGNTLRIEFDTRDMENCDACIALVYAGKSAPKYPGQFSTDYKPLGKSWQRHVLRLSVEPPTAAALQADTVVAIGFTNLDTSAESELQRTGIDNLSVTLDAGPPPVNY
jgi:hypothetical protein